MSHHSSPQQIPRHVSQQRRGLTAIDAVTALIVILLVVQVWLLSATLDAFLAGHRETALPGAIVSGVLCVACLTMYGFIRRVDRDARSGR
jgi:predicted Co/Zn/Cd cation transporter (cation efflux family)